MTEQSPAPEETLWEGLPSRWNWWLELKACSLLLLLSLALCWTGRPRFAPVPALCAVFLYGGVNLKRRSRRYRVTNQRLIEETGIFSIISIEMEIMDIRNINMAQNITQRLVRIGSLEFATAANDGVDIHFAGISDPAAVKEIVRQARLKAPRKVENAQPE